MVNGERHYFLGQHYWLRVHEQAGPARVAVRGAARSGAAALAPRTVESAGSRAAGGKGARLGHQENENQMGSCNVAARRIWLNLELEKTRAVPGVHRGA